MSTSLELIRRHNLKLEQELNDLNIKHAKALKVIELQKRTLEAATEKMKIIKSRVDSILAKAELVK